MYGANVDQVSHTEMGPHPLPLREAPGFPPCIYLLLPYLEEKWEAGNPGALSVHPKAAELTPGRPRDTSGVRTLSDW